MLRPESFALSPAVPPQDFGAPAPCPPEIAFLAQAGVSALRLAEAAALAQAQAIAPEAALLAPGDLSDAFFYHALADHLGVAFADGCERLGRGAR
ncbi:hypothetical protein [Methylocella sp.]|uniref:hypothetical protein n=1 Tax=Methylocella sp. TaxID=1978226 RepID=UPI0037846CA2